LLPTFFIAGGTAEAFDRRSC